MEARCSLDMVTFAPGFKQDMKTLLAALSLFLASQANAITYSAWIANYGLSGANALPTADPDHDGLPNLMEYALDGLSPIVNTPSTHPSVPVIGFVRRTGAKLGNWEWAGPSIPTNGVNGIWHVGIRFIARPDVEGIRYIPQISDGKLKLWFDGRSAFTISLFPGNVVQAVADTKGNRYTRAFCRLCVKQDSRVGNAFGGVTVSGTPTQALILQTPTQQLRTVGTPTVTALTSQDLNILRETAPSRVTDYRWVWTPFDQNLQAISVTRTSTNLDVLRPSDTDPFAWEWVGNGTATLRLRTQTSTYTETVSASTLAGGVVDTVTGATTGSLRNHLETSMEAFVVGKSPSSALYVYTTQDHATSTYVRNPSLWANGVDLTSISPWNSGGGAHQAGIAIAPRYVLFATHYTPGTGSTIRFITNDNVVVTRTLTNIQALTWLSGYYPDLAVGKLDSDLPGTIKPAKVLPDNWTTYLPTLATKSVPACCTDQEEKLLVRDLYSMPTSGTKSALFRLPSTAQQRLFYEDVIGGDSSNPACLIVNNELVLLTCWTGGGGGSGTSVQGFRSEINAAITTLGGGATLTNIDLSGFTTF